MALGSISSLGIGSGFELQDMLDQLRAADEVPVDSMKTEKADLETKIAEYDSVNTKLIKIKSIALSLSLESNFLKKSVTSTDEDVITASVQPGTYDGNHTVETIQLAKKSSWQTIGFAKPETVLFNPPITGIQSPGEVVTFKGETDDTDISSGQDINSVELDETAASANAKKKDDEIVETLTISIGSGDAQKVFQVDLVAGLNLNQVAKAINKHEENQAADGTSLVTANVQKGSNGYYLQLKPTTTDSSEDSTITASGLTFVATNLSFSYKVGPDGENQYVSVPPSMSFQELAEMINSDENNPGVVASVINDGSNDTPYRFTMTAKESGEANRITITGASMTEVQGALGASLNARISVDGIEYQRAGNDGIKDVIQGVSLNLKATGTSSISVSGETEFMETEIKGLIEAYNELAVDIKDKSKYDSDTGEQGPLAGSFAVKGLVSRINDLFSTQVDLSNTPYTSLYDLGLELSKEGDITLNEETFQQVLKTNREGIMNLFIGDRDTQTKGLGDIINEELRQMTSDSGVVNAEKSSAQGKIDRLDKNIEDSIERLDRRYESMTREFILLDQYMGQLQSQGSYLSSIFESFDKTTTKN